MSDIRLCVALGALAAVDGWTGWYGYVTGDVEMLSTAATLLVLLLIAGWLVGHGDYGSEDDWL